MGACSTATPSRRSSPKGLTVPDVILASLPPMEGPMAALRLRARFGCRVITDVMDAWPETLLLAAVGGNVGRFEGGKLWFAKRLLYPYARMMRRACREADAVCAQSQAFAAHARGYGATGDIPVFYLAAKARDASAHETEFSNQEPGTKNQEPHPPQLETGKLETEEPQPLPTFPPLPLPTFPPLHLPTSSALRLIYLGSMGRIYDLATLVEAVIALRAEGLPVELDVVGEGAQRAELAARVAEAGEGPAIRLPGYLSGDALEAVLAVADVGIVPMDPGSLVAVPYKAADYLSAGLAGVNSLPGELAELLEAHACGNTYEVGDVQRLVTALRFWQSHPDDLVRAKANARQLFAEKFDRAKVYAEMAEFLVSGS